jgi:hypothetical protein
MVFIMRCCGKPDPFKVLLSHFLAMLLFALLAVTSTAYAEGSIRVKSLALEAVDEGYQFDADFDISLNRKLEYALEKGMVLYFVTELNLFNSRWYWFDERIAQSRVREGLSYYPLTRQYRVSRGALYQNFGTLKEALHALGRVRSRPIVPNFELKPDTEYTAELRMRLDIAALPKPFQVETLSSKDWDLSTGILRWSTRLPSPRTQEHARL